MRIALKISRGGPLKSAMLERALLVALQPHKNPSSQSQTTTSVLVNSTSLIMEQFLYHQQPQPRSQTITSIRPFLLGSVLDGVGAHPHTRRTFLLPETGSMVTAQDITTVVLYILTVHNHRMETSKRVYESRATT